MDYFDVYDKDGTFISSEDENDVHYKGLWHKVVRIWLYDNEGNIWLRKDKNTGKFDTIGEFHLLSNESISNCYDRGLFSVLGMHLPSTSVVSFAGKKDMSYEIQYSNNLGLKENYFLCDYIANFDGKNKFFIFDQNTIGLVKCNVLGILNLLSSKVFEIVGYEYGENIVSTENKVIITYGDIVRDSREDNFSKFSPVLTTISNELKRIEKEKKEEQKIKDFAEKSKEENLKSHANENDGTEVY